MATGCDETERFTIQATIQAKATYLLVTHLSEATVPATLDPLRLASPDLPHIRATDHTRPRLSYRESMRYPLACVYHPSQKNADGEAVGTGSMCGKPAPRSERDPDKPKHPNRWGEPLCFEHRRHVIQFVDDRLREHIRSQKKLPRGWNVCRERVCHRHTWSGDREKDPNERWCGLHHPRGTLKKLRCWNEQQKEFAASNAEFKPQIFTIQRNKHHDVCCVRDCGRYTASGRKEHELRKRLCKTHTRELQKHEDSGMFKIGSRVTLVGSDVVGVIVDERRGPEVKFECFNVKWSDCTTSIRYFPNELRAAQ